MKIKITENQLNRLKDLITEELNAEKYTREVTFEIYFKGLYKGYDVNYISPVKLPLVFDINVERKSWGIGDISLSNIIGPSEVTTMIDYYLNNDETDEEEFKFNINWGDIEKIDLEKVTDSGIVTLDDTADIYLFLNDDNQVVVGRIDLKYLTV